MKKLYINTVLITALSLSAVSPTIAQQEQSSVQTKQSAFKRFKAAIADRWDISKKDAKALFTWGKKKVTWQTISQKESEAAARAFKRTGIPAGIILAILAAITIKKYPYNWQAKKALKDSMNPDAYFPLKKDTLNDQEKALKSKAIKAAEKRGDDFTICVLEHPQHVNSYQGGDDGNTALHQAAQRGDGEVIILLLKLGADPHIRDLNNQTALDILNSI